MPKKKTSIQKKPMKYMPIEGRWMIRNLYRYLKEELSFTLLHKDCPCDFRHLRNIGRRTSEASGVCARTVHRILHDEDKDKAALAATTTTTTSTSTSLPSDPNQPYVIMDDDSSNRSTSATTNTSSSTTAIGSTPVIASTPATGGSTTATTTSSTANIRTSNILFMEINEDGRITKTFLK